MKMSTKFLILTAITGALMGCKPGPITLGGGAPVPVTNAQGKVTYVSYNVNKKRVVAVPPSTGTNLTTNKINAAFAQDNALNPYQINVVTNHFGEVTLSGSVPNERVKDYAIKVARHTKGVMAVKAKNLIVTDQ